MPSVPTWCEEDWFPDARHLVSDTHTHIHKLCTKMVFAYVKIYYKADGYNGNVVMLIRYSLLMESIASLSGFARNGL